MTTDTTEEAPAQTPPRGSVPAIPDQTPAYMSYSRMDSILTCGWKFHLERNLKVPVTEHWASIGGNAFHTSVEKLLLLELSSRED
ncbi:MAG TPA: hypothetical protein VFH56_03380 [Acidimicrobiales bacterium]|nr:hypothetical protein [Acidimicrobiales bacterium]